jgi:predicted Kef-type K+ transport protein
MENQKEIEVIRLLLLTNFTITEIIVNGTILFQLLNDLLRFESHKVKKKKKKKTKKKKKKEKVMKYS